MTSSLFSAAEAAASLGIEQRSFRRWAVTPARIEAGKRLYDGAAILANRLERMKHQRRRPETTAAEMKAEISELQTELDRARAAGTALENAAARGEILPLDDFTHAIARACVQARVRLDTLPGKIKRQVPAMTNMEIHLVRSEIADGQNTAADSSVDWPTIWRRVDAA